MSLRQMGEGNERYSTFERNFANSADEEGPLPLDIRLKILEFLATERIRSLYFLMLTNRTWYRTLLNADANYIWLSNMRHPPEHPLPDGSLLSKFIAQYIDRSRESKCKECGKDVWESGIQLAHPHPLEPIKTPCCAQCLASPSSLASAGLIRLTEQQCIRDWHLYFEEITCIYRETEGSDDLHPSTITCLHDSLERCSSAKKKRRELELSSLANDFSVDEQVILKNALEEATNAKYAGLERDSFVFSLRTSVNCPALVDLKRLIELHLQQVAVKQNVRDQCPDKKWKTAERALKWLRLDSNDVSQQLGTSDPSWLAYLSYTKGRSVNGFLEEAENPTKRSVYPSKCSGCLSSRKVDLRCAHEYCKLCCPRVDCPAHTHSFASRLASEEDLDAEADLINDYYGGPMA